MRTNNRSRVSRALYNNVNHLKKTKPKDYGLSDYYKKLNQRKSLESTEKPDYLPSRSRHSYGNHLHDNYSRSPRKQSELHYDYSDAIRNPHRGSHRSFEKLNIAYRQKAQEKFRHKQSRGGNHSLAGGAPTGGPADDLILRERSNHKKHNSSSVIDRYDDLYKFKILPKDAEAKREERFHKPGGYQPKKPLDTSYGRSPRSKLAQSLESPSFNFSGKDHHPKPSTPYEDKYYNRGDRRGAVERRGPTRGDHDIEHLVRTPSMILKNESLFEENHHRKNGKRGNYTRKDNSYMKYDLRGGGSTKHSNQLKMSSTAKPRHSVAKENQWLGKSAHMRSSKENRRSLGDGREGSHEPAHQKQKRYGLTASVEGFGNLKRSKSEIRPRDDDIKNVGILEDKRTPKKLKALYTKDIDINMNIFNQRLEKLEDKLNTIERKRATSSQQQNLLGSSYHPDLNSEEKKKLKRMKSSTKPFMVLTPSSGDSFAPRFKNISPKMTHSRIENIAPYQHEFTRTSHFSIDLEKEPKKESFLNKQSLVLERSSSGNKNKQPITHHKISVRVEPRASSTNNGALGVRSQEIDNRSMGMSSSKKSKSTRDFAKTLSALGLKASCHYDIQGGGGVSVDKSGNKNYQKILNQSSKKKILIRDDRAQERRSRQNSTSKIFDQSIFKRSQNYLLTPQNDRPALNHYSNKKQRRPEPLDSPKIGSMRLLGHTPKSAIQKKSISSKMNNFAKKIKNSRKLKNFNLSNLDVINSLRFSQKGITTKKNPPPSGNSGAVTRQSGSESIVERRNSIYSYNGETEAFIEKVANQDYSPSYLCPGFGKYLNECRKQLHIVDDVKYFMDRNYHQILENFHPIRLRRNFRSRNSLTPLRLS